ncbi:hypothetical protein ES702_01523 [subsurface metagenome]
MNKAELVEEVANLVKTCYPSVIKCMLPPMECLALCRK